jgi:hypothetical protein
MSGRTRPSRVVCEKADRSLVEVVAKFSSGCDRGEASLAMEVVGACLAADLGLPVPTPFLLEVQTDWVDTVTNTEHQRLMRASSSIAFGSTEVGTGFRAWTTGDRPSATMLPIAAGIFVFDVAINNPDRRDDNPNCLIRGNDLRIFDHELAFVYKGIIGWQPPWNMGSLAPFATPGQHIFHRGLVGQAIDVAPIRAAWVAISDERLADYKAAIPNAWSNVLPAVDDAVGLIQGVRDHIDGVLAEVMRVLA